MDTSPDPNATALDGVATGSIYAEQTARVIAIVMNTGSIPTPTATAPMIGRNAALVAVFDVSSVSTMPMIMTARMITIGGSAEGPRLDRRIHADSPVAVQHLGEAETTAEQEQQSPRDVFEADHGSSAACDGSARRRSAGTMKVATAAAMAT